MILLSLARQVSRSDERVVTSTAKEVLLSKIRKI